MIFAILENVFPTHFFHLPFLLLQVRGICKSKFKCKVGGRWPISRIESILYLHFVLFYLKLTFSRSFTITRGKYTT